MTKKIYIFVLIFNILTISFVEVNAKPKEVVITTKCLFGIKYYTWKGKPMSVNIPVVKNGELVRCE